MALNEVSVNQTRKHSSCVACNKQEKKKTHCSLKPSKNKNVLDIRIVHGHPNKAWIECYNNSYDIYAECGQAERSALKEELRLQEYHAVKQVKLKKFQQEVVNRVSYLHKMKKKESEMKAAQLAKEEEYALLQRIEGIKAIHGHRKNTFNAPSDEKMEGLNNTYDLHHDNIEQFNTDTYNLQHDQNKENDLTNDTWNIPSSQDIAGWQGVFAVKPLTQIVEWNETINQNSKDFRDNDFSEIKSSKLNDESNPNVTKLQENIIHDAALISQDNDIRQKMLKNQYWKLRKLFMNIEREEVKQNRREKEKHLQTQKYYERMKAKRFSSSSSDAYLDVILPTSYQPLPQFTEDCNNDDEVSLKEKKKGEKRKELLRYMEALRATAKQRFQICNIQLPNLCDCAESFWDSHPDRCKPQCEFYRNPKAYVNSLAASLATTH